MCDPGSVLYEFGHFQDYLLGFPEVHQTLYEEAQQAGTVLGKYAKTNSREYFAEYAQYWLEHYAGGEGMVPLREVSPRTYAYFMDLTWGIGTTERAGRFPRGAMKIEKRHKQRAN